LLWVGRSVIGKVKYHLLHQAFVHDLFSELVETLHHPQGSVHKMEKFSQDGF